MKHISRLSRSGAISLLRLISSGTCHAQINDFFSAVLNKVAGFNGWWMYNVWNASEDQRPQQETSGRLAISLKYGPFEFGQKEDKTTTIKVTRTYLSTTPCKLVIDSTVTDPDGKTIFHSADTTVFSSTDPRGTTPPCG